MLTTLIFFYVFPAFSLHSIFSFPSVMHALTSLLNSASAVSGDMVLDHQRIKVLCFSLKQGLRAGVRPTQTPFPAQTQDTLCSATESFPSIAQSHPWRAALRPPMWTPLATFWLLDMRRVSMSVWPLDGHAPNLSPCRHLSHMSC